MRCILNVYTLYSMFANENDSKEFSQYRRKNNNNIYSSEKKRNRDKFQRREMFFFFFKLTYTLYFYKNKMSKWYSQNISGLEILGNEKL